MSFFFFSLLSCGGTASPNHIRENVTSDLQHTEEIMLQKTLACGLSSVCKNELYHLGIMLTMSKKKAILNREFVYD